MRQSQGLWQEVSLPRDTACPSHFHYETIYHYSRCSDKNLFSFCFSAFDSPPKSMRKRKKQGGSNATPLLFLVEVRGIEPLSEHSSAQPSSWTVCLFHFPKSSGGKQPLHFGSPFLLGLYKCELQTQVPHYMTLSSRPWDSERERVAKTPQHCR